jgi:hypothetical protein
LENVGLKMSPATFSEYFRLIDETHQNHLTRQMMEWDFQKEGFLEASSDFKDYEAFENIGQFSNINCLTLAGSVANLLSILILPKMAERSEAKSAKRSLASKI